MADDPRFRDDPQYDETGQDHDPGLSLAARLGGFEEDESPAGGGVAPAGMPKREMTREERRLEQERIAAQAPPFEGAAPPVALADSPLARPLIIVLVVVLLGVIAVVAWPYIFKKDSNAVAPTPGSGSSGSEEQPGALVEVTLDDSFEAAAAEAMEAGNAAWKDAGLDAWVYRFNVLNIIDPGKSQRMTLRAYVGGPDAAKAVAAPHDEAFRTALTPFLEQQNANEGVEALLDLNLREEGNVLGSDEVYVRYGYDYGMEHMDELQPLIDALENYKASEGQYPDSLDSQITGERIKTKGGYFFDADGFGYLPLFATGGDGSILMGTGTGIARYTPQEVTGYVLVKYLSSPNLGIDLHSPADEIYYQEKIAPFPYQAPPGLKNVPLNPDGKPDGIAAVVRSGELQN